MVEECRYCGSRRVRPVLVARMQGRPQGGNPFKDFCTSCDRWLAMTSRDRFKEHLHPLVLPRDGDESDPDDIIPLEDWDESERFEDVLARLENYRDRDQPGVDDDAQVAVADGGEVEESINRFGCPGCGEEVTGKPEQCPHCEAPYNW